MRQRSLVAGNVGWRRVEDAADPGLEDGCKRGAERYLARVVLDLDAGDLQHVFIGAQGVLLAPLVSEDRQLEPGQLHLAGGGLKSDVFGELRQRHVDAAHLRSGFVLDERHRYLASVDVAV